jgi:hypothetical protein
MRTLTALLASAALLAAGAAAAGNWQDLPDSLQLQAVGDTLRMNGTPMTIRAVSSRQPIETVLREVQANWEKPHNSAPVKRTEGPNWSILNQTVGDQHRSFQVHQKGDLVEGFAALTSPKLTREPKLGLRLPPQMIAMQVVDSVDNGKASQQVTAVSRRSVDISASALETALKAEGWKRHIYKKQGDAVLVSANRGDEQFDAILSAQKAGALVMINIVR